MPTALVIGSGIAGLIAAIRLSRSHEVTLVTKTALGDGSTMHAQGGIAAALFDDDSPRLHASDTRRVGGGLNSREAVDILCSEGPARVRDLIALGVRFDREGGADGTDGRGGALARGLEAAHSRSRVIHAGGDQTGAAVQTALILALHESRVRVVEHAFVTELVTEAGSVAGALLLHRDGRLEQLDADRVILATGGAGQLYSHTSNPLVSTGDGVALALRAGAALRDLEFYQFHPTTLAAPDNFLISEAVRGEGAVLLDAEGRRFMLGEHDDAELAPRDVVARSIARRTAEQGGVPVLLDATALGADFLAERFPGITAAAARHGFDWRHEPIPVTPAAHYWMGGVRTDEWGRTSIPGLFAVGEVACTGVHGANRLASNSLLEALVFAWRCADAAADPWPDDETPLGETATLTAEPTHEFESLSPGDEPVGRAALQSLMWDHAGLFRSEESLTEAAAQLARWHAPAPASGPAPASASQHGPDEAIAAAETANLLELARVLVAAARARRESRGAHFRSDHPRTDPAFARHLDLAGKAVVLC